jgi:hypothetical protein
MVRARWAERWVRVRFRVRVVLGLAFWLMLRSTVTNRVIATSKA